MLLALGLLLIAACDSPAATPGASEPDSTAEAEQPARTAEATADATLAAAPETTPSRSPAATEAATLAPDTVALPTSNPTPDAGLDRPSSSGDVLPGIALRPAFPNLQLERLTNLVQPDDGTNRIFITEQWGRIRVFPNEPTVEHPGMFLDIQGRSRGGANEEGLLGLAFSPDFAENGHFFVYYSAIDPRRSVLSRFTVSDNDPNLADVFSEIVILEVEQPYSNHNGGQIEFGPDGYLYVALGDGGLASDPMGNGQNTGTLLGSILRLDVSGVSPDAGYAIPLDNPFVGVSGARGEIWAYGLRNPWRFSFDSEIGLMWAADVGQNSYEEIDVVKRGGNYGWNIMEGLHCFSPSQGCDTAGLEMPVAEYGRSEGCSVTGGHVYRGSDLPGLVGAYVYADFCTGRIWGISYDGETATEPQLLVDSDLAITSFGRGLDGSLYVLSRDDGVYIAVPAETP